jgi:hypothetical protein
MAHALDLLSRLCYRWHQGIESKHSLFKLEQFIAVQVCVPWGLDRLASFVLFGALLQLNRESATPLFTLLLALDNLTSAIHLYIVVQLLQGRWDRRQTRSLSHSNLSWHLWLQEVRGTVGVCLGAGLVLVSLAQEGFMLLIYFRGFAGGVAAGIAVTNAAELHQDDERIALEEMLSTCRPVQVALGNGSAYLVRWLLDAITLQGDGTSWFGGWLIQSEVATIYALALGAICKAGIGIAGSVPLLF